MIRPVLLPCALAALALAGCEYAVGISDLEGEPAGYPDPRSGQPASSAGTGGTTSAGGSTGGAGGPLTGGAAGGGNPITCDGYCNKLATTGCSSAPTPAVCVADCNEVASICPPQTNALVACVVERGTTMCAPDGVAVAGCSAEFSALTSCAACAPAAGDDGCDRCLKGSCCSEMQGLLTDPSASDFLDCISPCQTASCFDVCSARYPSAGLRFDALAGCLVSRCSVSCR